MWIRDQATAFKNVLKSKTKMKLYSLLHTIVSSFFEYLFIKFLFDFFIGLQTVKNNFCFHNFLTFFIFLFILFWFCWLLTSFWIGGKNQFFFIEEPFISSHGAIISSFLINNYYMIIIYHRFFWFFLCDIEITFGEPEPENK